MLSTTAFFLSGNLETLSHQVLLQYDSNGRKPALAGLSNLGGEQGVESLKIPCFDSAQCLLGVHCVSSLGLLQVRISVTARDFSLLASCAEIVALIKVL